MPNCNSKVAILICIPTSSVPFSLMINDTDHVFFCLFTILLFFYKIALKILPILMFFLLLSYKSSIYILGRSSIYILDKCKICTKMCSFMWLTLMGFGKKKDFFEQPQVHSKIEQKVHRFLYTLLTSHYQHPCFSSPRLIRWPG